VKGVTYAGLVGLRCEALRLRPREVGLGFATLPLGPTRSDLASPVGASRERVNQIMTTYKQLGYLTVDRNHRITVRNPDARARQYR
jgi:CRP-like cAMP-binding protein